MVRIIVKSLVLKGSASDRKYPPTVAPYFPQNKGLFLWKIALYNKDEKLVYQKVDFDSGSYIIALAPTERSCFLKI